MLARIKVHNYVNGFRFCVWEFVVASLLVLPFTVWFLAQGKYLYGVVGVGLIMNFLVVVTLAVQSLRRGEQDRGILQFFNKQRRGEIHAEYPHLDADTGIVCVALILPFVTLAGVMIDLAKTRTV
jgi:hypothetical protein